MRNSIRALHRGAHGLVRNYARNTAAYVIPRMMAIGAQLIFLPFVLHNLTLRDYGLFSLATMIANLVSLLSFPQLTYGSKVALARGLDGQFFFSLLKRCTISLPLLALCVIVLIGLSGITESTFRYVAMVVLFNTLLADIVAQSITSFWVAKERFFTAASVDLMRALIVNGAGALVAVTTRDLVAFVVTRAICDLCFATAMLLFTSLSRQLWSAYQRGEIDTRLSVFGFRMLGANIAVVARTEGLSFLVAAMFNLEVLAIFRVAYSNIYYRIQNQLSMMTDLLYAKNAREKSGVTDRVRFKQFFILGCVGFGIALGGCAASYVYVMLLLPAEYSRAFYYTLILLCALPLDIVYSYVNQLFLVRYAAGKVTLLLVAHLVAQLTMLPLMTWSFGLLGACASVPVSLVLALALGIVMERRLRAHPGRAAA